MADRIPKPRKTGSDTPRRRRVSGAIDQAPMQAVPFDEEGRVTGSGIRTVKQQHDANWAKTRERAAECRTLLAGEMPQVLPKNFKLANADSFAADLPATYTRPAEMLAQNLKKQVEIKRFITTESQRSKTTSSTIEQILTAVMNDDHRYPWDETCDIEQNDALGCVITQPMPSFWEQCDDWMDPDTKTFKEAYQRDGQGRSKREVGKGFRLNKKSSKKAYDEYLADYAANNLPILYRAFGPQEITPIFGPKKTVEAVIVSGMYQRTSEMASQFIWGEDDHLSPQGVDNASWSSGGAGSFGEVEILEFWGYDKKRRPYVAYCVDGKATTYTNGDPAYIDLSPYCSRLPVSIKWGQHWPGAPKLDQRALPYMWAFLQSIKQANAIATGIAVALWWAGFPTYTTDRSASAVPVPPGATPRTLDIEPLKLIETDGPVTRLSGGEVSGDAWRFVSLLLGENEKAQAPASGEGGSNASGFAQTIARAYSEDAQHMILEGIRQLYEESASFTLEILSNIAKAKDRPVLVYYSGPVVSLEENDNVTSTRARLELTPDLAGGQWKITAQYRPSMSLAERQQSAELVERRLKTRYKHLADDGDPAPERTMAQIEAEDLVTSEIGQQQRWALIAQILGDDQMAELVKLKDQQRVSQVGGLPFSLAEGFEDILAKRAAAEAAANGGGQAPMPPQMTGGAVGRQGIQPGAPQGGQMTGLGGSTTAQASLAGAVGGEMQAGPMNRAAAAGGAVPPDMMGG